MKMKNLKKYQVGGTGPNMDLSIPLPQTPDGRTYRYSPNEDAHPRHFVLGNRENGFSGEERKRERMKQEPGSSKTICPYSGVVGDDADFTHPKDREAAIKIVEHAAVQDVQAAFSDMLKGVARKSGGGITYKPGARNKRPKPRFGRRDLMRLLICDCCGRDYGVFAIALYCPDCGAPNISLHFAREVELVLQQVTIAEDLGEDQDELAYRLLGNAHEDVLTAFEAAQKVVYLHRLSSGDSDATAVKPVRNDFQNVEKARRRYAEFEIDPFVGLSDSERELLGLNIQKRHVIGHNLGVVDAKFAENARHARLGETVELLGTDIREFSRLCRVVVSALDDWLADVSLRAATAAEKKTSCAKEQEPVSETVGDLSDMATGVGRWLCEKSTNGLPDNVDEDAVSVAFADTDMDVLSEALAELELEGCIELSHVIGPRPPRIRTTEELFLLFDPVVIDAKPLKNAMHLIDLVLTGDGSVGLSELHNDSGMKLRNFNPAAGLLLGEIGEGRVSRTYSPDYPARRFAINAEDRVALKRLRKRLAG
jgi:hypothetical protein